MLQIETVIHEFVASLGPTITSLERKNRSLADQLDRASASVLLNVAEGKIRDRVRIGDVAGNRDGGSAPRAPRFRAQGVVRA